MANKQMNKEVWGREEVWVQDDAEAAFWDEFMKMEEESVETLVDEGEITLRFVDEWTGEEWEVEGLTGEREVLRAD